MCRKPPQMPSQPVPPRPHPWELVGQSPRIRASWTRSLPATAGSWELYQHLVRTLAAAICDCPSVSEHGYKSLRTFAGFEEGFFALASSFGGLLSCSLCSAWTPLNSAARASCSATPAKQHAAGARTSIRRTCRAVDTSTIVSYH